MPAFVKKMLSLLSTQERAQLYLLIIGMVMMAVIDVICVGSIMPFMAVVTNPSVIIENQWLNLAYRELNFESTNTFLLALGAAVLFTLVLSNASTAVITWLIYKYTWLRNHSISRRLFEGYLSRSYSFFLDRNTADLEKNILEEVQLIVVGILSPILMIVKNGVMVLFIFTLLIFMDPILATIVSLILGSSYCILFFMTSKVLSRIGWERAEANKFRFKTINEALSGIKALRVLGREQFFLERFSVYSFKVSNNFAKKAIIAQLPRYAFEVVAFGGVLLIIMYFLAFQRNMEEIIPLLSLYAFAGYRLMPSMQTIFTKAANIKYAIPSLELVHNDLYNDISMIGVTSAGETIQRIQLNDAIYLKSIDFSYPGQDEPVLKKFDLSIPCKTTVGFAGTTGSGKTTIIDIILGLINPTSGALWIDNQKVDQTNVVDWQKKIGYVPQEIFLIDDSIENNIAFGVDRAGIDTAAVFRAAKTANLHDFITSELDDGYNTIVGERGVKLSGGQRQRIGIARALYHDPEVLVLDEATSALDGVTEDTIMQAIHDISHRITIIMIAHRITTLKVCDQIYVLEKGNIAAHGSYTDLLEQSEYFKILTTINQTADNSI